MIKAIIFDADNTIYYTKKAAKKGDMAAMKFFSKQTNKPASSLYNEWKSIADKIRSSKDPVKRHRRYSYSMLAKKHGLKNANRAYEIFLTVMLNNLTIEPTFRSSLRKLKKLKRAIVSEDFQGQLTQKMRKFKLLKRFDAIITSHKAGTMKPSANYYRLAFKKLNVKAKECIVVGDNFEKDLKIPKGLGCTTVIFGKKDKRAHYSVNDFNQIVKIVKEKNKSAMKGD